MAPGKQPSESSYMKAATGKAPNSTKLLNMNDQNTSQNLPLIHI